MDYSILCLLHFPGREVPEERYLDERSSIGNSDGDVGSVRSGRDEGATEAFAAGGGSTVLGAMRNAASALATGGKAAEDDSDDDDESGTVSSLGLPKLTDDDLAAA